MMIGGFTKVLSPGVPTANRLGGVLMVMVVLCCFDNVAGAASARPTRLEARVSLVRGVRRQADMASKGARR